MVLVNLDSDIDAPEGSVKMVLGQMLNKVIATAEDLRGVHVSSLLNVKSGSQPVISGPSKLTQQELQVLRDTMTINGNKYYPWSDEDIEGLFRDKVLFEDPDGKLALSAEQEKNFGSWRRASEIMVDPKMVYLVSSLIRACIYPKNEYGEPRYNPYGKYLVKLMFNGIHRRVVVDDYLPVSRTGELMCTCSKIKNELWPSIIEKAYMKVMGGYNFPGSNSSTDLYALTGWVPEHVFIKKCDRDQQWSRILNGQRAGLALVTIATGFMDDEMAEEKGLVPTHAYAVLDIREVNGLRLLQVKNPWSRKRWKGRFSHLDAENWTEELKTELGYDQSAALKHDDGIFWIDYDSVCDEFDTIHINWNPEMLKHRMVVHTLWPYSGGPKQDNWNFGNNPQYTLVTDVKTSNRSSVWLLLSKHITETEEKSTDYIALHVFDIEKLRQDPDYTYVVDSTPTTPTAAKAGTPSHQRSLSTLQEVAQRKGTRIYYEDGSIHKGSYVNSQHILVRLDAPVGQNEYTIVLSQNFKTRDLYFTLRVFATCEFNIRTMPNKYNIKKEIKGEWTEETAGGNKCCAGYMNNPQYRLVVPDLPPPQTTTSVLFALESSSSIHLLVQLMNNNGERVSCVWSKDVIAQAREYRHKFNYCEANNLRSGTYTVVVSTYDPGIIGKFNLTMQSQIKLSLTPIPAEGAGMFKKKIEGKWARGLHRRSELNFARNPYFVVHITEMTSIM
ncbi:calpain 7 [Mortierella sp. NVP85]|nr:calpain 7 [Mortierella sp. NVP85]